MVAAFPMFKEGCNCLCLFIFTILLFPIKKINQFIRYVRVKFKKKAGDEV
jgi:hypothetical protein